jgi:predicted phosphodiesterase
MTTLVLISDTHSKHRESAIPFGDILIHAGDIWQHALPILFFKEAYFFSRLKNRFHLSLDGG